jgi:aminoglycoside phosphotransferase (APT) family kinase protein
MSTASPHNPDIELTPTTVRRPAGAPGVWRLLLHLEARGFEAAPRYLGQAADGRDVVSFLPGEVAHYPIAAERWSDASLTAAARLLRRYHDATLGFVPAPDDAWAFAMPPDQPREVICHNDFAQYNVVYSGATPTAIIDFEFAAPGSRAWDLAYAAYRFVPLSEPAKHRMFGVPDPVDVAHRLRAFVAAYGGLSDPAGFPSLVRRRVAHIRAMTVEVAAAGGPKADRVVAERHLESYDADLAWLAVHAPALAL